MVLRILPSGFVKSKAAFLMARPFCCAKASDTTSLRPVAPLRRSAWADQRAPAALPDACNKNPPSFIPCNAAIPYALPSRPCRDTSAFLPAALPAAYRDDPPPLNSRCTKNISSVLPPRIAAINPITLPPPTAQSRFCRALRKPVPAARRTAVLKNVSRETFWFIKVCQAA